MSEVVVALGEEVITLEHSSGRLGGGGLEGHKLLARVISTVRPCINNTNYFYR